MQNLGQFGLILMVFRFKGAGEEDRAPSAAGEKRERPSRPSRRGEKAASYRAKRPALLKAVIRAIFYFGVIPGKEEHYV